MLSLLAACFALGVQGSKPDAGYKLVWHDEFSRSGRPNPKNWSFEHGFVRNKELQWYEPENAWVRDGYLVIEGRREVKQNPDYEPLSKDWRKKRMQAEYTSACLETRGLYAFRYGRLEVRAKIDALPGLWPAIWSLGVRGSWPRNGEVDQLEFYRNTILANTAWADGTWNTVRTPYSHFTEHNPDWGSKFHIWRMDWDENSIKIYVDDELLNDTDLSKTLNPDGTNPFHQPEYLLLNLAIGSTGGDPSKTTFPVRLVVDYVRVYQKK